MKKCLFYLAIGIGLASCSEKKQKPVTTNVKSSVENITQQNQEALDDALLTSFINDVGFDFLNKCYYERNLNTYIRDEHDNLKEFMDPAIGLRRYHLPGAMVYLSGKDENYGFMDFDDFEFEPTSQGESTLSVMDVNQDPCELDFNQGRTAYLHLVKELPEYFSQQTNEIEKVVLPYKDAKIIVMYVMDKYERPKALFFIDTPKGMKLGFVDDAVCGNR
ncbi:hypothetical protein ACILDS_01525 [Capnocytophaga canis]|uniref:hypothetical protein n=1 Tax=Capnocytophaga canis TaxID=1848903 RepID=UPI0037CF334B